MPGKLSQPSPQAELLSFLPWQTPSAIVGGAGIWDSTTRRDRDADRETSSPPPLPPRPRQDPGVPLKRKLVFTSSRPRQVLCNTKLGTGEGLLRAWSHGEGDPVPKPREHPLPGILWAPFVHERAAFALGGDPWASGPLRTVDIVSRD